MKNLRAKDGSVVAVDDDFDLGDNEIVHHQTAIHGVKAFFIMKDGKKKKLASYICGSRHVEHKNGDYTDCTKKNLNPLKGGYFNRDSSYGQRYKGVYSRDGMVYAIVYIDDKHRVYIPTKYCKHSEEIAGAMYNYACQCLGLKGYRNKVSHVLNDTEKRVVKGIVDRLKRKWADAEER